MRYFIEEREVDPKEMDRIQQTALYYAAREGKYRTCEYLISKGVELNRPDYYLQTPIYYAAR
jgi:ankyrin repeat protein